ncbi:tetratricopeptide repeat protein,tetratricopeptide repeat protein,protein kinase family protein [Cylindrospermum stagnale PCC 7417]|uniref:Tetratricopeptide repeat protein,tetratricopeptide repeat protein,protein kinase family protein n=1 Tax=Cylindrospermum stagnale PCC 7417 TaxID=56107 RepID=K9WW81_9NOST|nr:tetratricopeptide repeat protein [Cylindrospermum stagnale]AFZ24473.1 tetratricopeptide repeat protein,tetratricopeptide repeat protein,protein kinase family protein [Cylindrospermum stagnale PCC 7417]
MLGNTLVGRYQIISHLGGGGFGETFIAYDTQLPGTPECVVKKLKPQSTDPVTLETARRLFDTEAQVLYKLGTHDRIPQLLAYFEENAEFYLVQEFIPGDDLSKEITPGTTLSQDQVISLLREILQILEFVHQQKVIHRDVNPRNILRRQQDGKLILIDFGAVKQITTQVIIPGGKTKSTVAIGTPGYIPGEQAQGTPKFSSDLYALGIIAIQSLTGLNPEQIEKDAETNEIIWRNSAAVSPEFAQFIDKMVCYDFRQRYPSAKLALQALQELAPLTSGTIALAPAALPNNIKTRPLNKKGIFLKFLLAMFLVGVSGTASVFIVKEINNNNATELYKQGNTFLELQRYQDALAVYEKAVNLKPNYVQGWNGQGKALFELKKYPEALAAYDKAIQIQPDYLEAWSGRGFSLANLQRYSEAIASFDRAIQLKNDYPEVWNAKGDAFRNLNQYDNAIKSYEKAIEFQPEYYEAWYKKGLALHNLKQYDEAVIAFNKVVELKPDYNSAWYSLGNALVNLNRYQDAFIAYDKAVQYKPSYNIAWFSRGNMLINLRRYPEAIESFNQVIKYNPSNYQAWYSRGWSLHQIQRYQEAIESYNKALALKRNDYLVWYALGNSQYSLQKYEDAIASYNKAVRYKADHYESWYSRGNAFLNLRRYQEAIASYEQAIKYKPNYQQAIDARNQAQVQLEATTSKPVVVPTITSPGLTP